VVSVLVLLPWRGAWWCTRPLLFFLGWLVFSSAGVARADDTAEGWKRFRAGDYPGAVSSARAVRQSDPRNEEAWRIEAEVLLAEGKYEEARAFLPKALRIAPYSLRLRLLLREAELQTGHQAEAAGELQQIATIANSSARYRRGPEFLSAAGEAGLLMGVEPRLVLENFLRPAERDPASSRDAFLAAGKLALEKHDYALASRTFQDGLAVFPDDPDLWSGLGSAFLNGDRTKLVEYAQRALAINPKHVPTLLLLAEHLIDTEDYAGAQHALAQVSEVNPHRPEALALLAVVAHLQNDEAAFDRFRNQALASWKTNPAVDHLIGRKLSQKYRFAEGAAAQRRALALDPSYTPARMQLAEDLLRLGKDDEGWTFANQAHEADPYDVTAYNLVALHDQLGKFTTLSTPHFRLRMSTLEASVYGQRALALLERERAQLTAKYGLNLDELVVTVEIYPDPKDFAVRTFGMPGRPGYLGVCFGPVVTINSPATQQANWESVLWHEFCHVITLTLTRNRMPRWLSEGLSVYEETLANPAWGRPMSASDSSRILEGKMQPIRQMSAAFLQAKTQEDVLFAYSQSALVVQFIVERYGFASIKALLTALRDGTEMNEALARHVAPLDDLENGFVPFAQAKARALGGGFDLAPPAEGLGGMVARMNPKNLPTQFEAIQELIKQKQWTEAKAKLVELTRRTGYVPGEYNLHLLLAKVCGELGEHDGERSALVAVTEHEGDALTAVSRLLALATEERNWKEVTHWSNQWLAINPLALQPWRAQLDAGEKLGATAEALTAGQTLLLLEPTDLAAVHYRVARLLQPTDPVEARKHVLLALAEAPRYRAAYALLDQLPTSPEKP